MYNIFRATTFKKDYRKLNKHKNFAWFIFIFFWIVVLFNVAEYRTINTVVTPNISCQNFLENYCGIDAFMGRPFNICGKPRGFKSSDLLPLIIASFTLFHWYMYKAGKISSTIIALQTFIIAKTNLSNDNFLIALLFFYATFSLLFYIIFYKSDSKKIYTE